MRKKKLRVGTTDSVVPLVFEDGSKLTDLGGIAVVTVRDGQLESISISIDHLGAKQLGIILEHVSETNFDGTRLREMVIAKRIPNKREKRGS